MSNVAYAEKRGKSWRVKYKLPTGKYDSESGFETKQDALDWGRAQETDVKRKVFINPSDGRKLFGEWVTDWQKVSDVGEMSQQTYGSRLRAVILPKWESTPIGDITSMGYKAWRVQLRNQYKKNYVDAIEGLMRMLLDDAVEEKLIPFNPMPAGSKRKRGRHVPVDTGDEYVWPTPRQARLLAENARELRGDQWYVMILTVAYTGLRMGEVAGLRRDQLNLLGLEYGRSLRVQWQGQWLTKAATHNVNKGDTLESIAALRHADPKRGADIATANDIQADAKLRAGQKLKLAKGFTLLPPKYSSYRTLILPPFLGDLLSELLAANSHDVLVFPSQRGKPLRVDDQFYGRFWHPAILGRDEEPSRRGRRAQEALPAVEGIADMVPHGLRHGHKVWLDGQGHPRVAVEERMGHKLQGVEGTYSHTSPEMELGIARGLQKAWEKSLTDEVDQTAEWRERRSS
ncbi:LysM peptidoglycan-binding domain-containing protein [Streptomyces sp. NBC_00441]|uniref:LysM peptidoglycan-binding domain-containing protein n=1 Tax=Streptomyces sp. NBC_00441 TaxID=2975742 RepID=UPI002E2B666F|nr:LysM peptidoglycan-binding domain-containing protein [Streptomyces sp. NBC_00441]